jgi:hypothetical protein
LCRALNALFCAGISTEIHKSWPQNSVPLFLTTVTRNQYPQVTGNQNQRYAQNSPDLRQKEIIKITNKVFIPAFCVDKFNAFACSGRTRPRRSELKD